ncbi:unnamed protein product, partial [Cylicocyclus nassatus]
MDSKLNLGITFKSFNGKKLSFVIHTNEKKKEGPIEIMESMLENWKFA